MRRLSASFVVMLTLVSPANAVQLEWARQFGTSRFEYGHAVSADGLGNVYVSGDTDGSLGGPSTGTTDAFVAKYDDAGNPLWTRQFGNTPSDIGSAISTDSLGNVYVSGRAGGDAFVAKYDAAGILQWTKQLGTVAVDESFGVSADGLGNVYISGSTQGSLGGSYYGRRDAFVTKYDDDGNHLWTRQFGGSSDDECLGASADGLGHVYVTGYTLNSLDGPNKGLTDAFVAKYDNAGNPLWMRQFGTIYYDIGRAVVADGLGNVFVSGEGYANLTNVFVAKYDAAGSLQWTKQFGSANQDSSNGVWTDGLGNVYLTGKTEGSLGDPSAGGWDAFVAKYDGDGNHQWTEQFGTVYDDTGRGLSGDGHGNLYVTGNTTGSLGGPNAGEEDAFVAKCYDGPASSSGDYSHNGIIDAADYTVWRDLLGSTTNLAADGNGNGSIDSGDYDVWRANFGQTADSGSGADANAAAPEPATAVLLMLTTAGWCLRRCPAGAEKLS